MTPPARYLVIGSGSVARRHVANLRSLFTDAEVASVSASGRPIQPEATGAHRVFDRLDDAVRWEPRFAVVASPAPWHASQAAALVKADVPVLIEKPLSSSLADFAKEQDTLLAGEHLIEVAYTLRHLPSAARVKSMLDEGRLGRVHSVLIDVGQYLPDWRPGTDYRLNVTAQRKLGGGVLAELSHEFDYLTWLFGAFDMVFCSAGNSGELEIDVEDHADALLMQRDGLVVNLHMDLLQRSVCRICKVVGSKGTLVWNLTANRIDLLGPDAAAECVYADPAFDRNQMYIAQLKHFARVAAGEAKPVVDLRSGLRTLTLIDALKRSAKAGEPVRMETRP